MKHIILLITLVVTACASLAKEYDVIVLPPAEPEPQAQAVPGAEPPPRWAFPKERQIEGGRMIIHAPQIDEWPGYKKATMLMAVEYFADGEETPRYATIEMSNTTVVDMDERVVTISEPKIERVTVAGKDIDNYEDKLAQLVRNEPLDVPLDVFLISVAQDAITIDNAKGFNPEPPKIFVSDEPTILLSITGEPQEQDIEKTDLKIIANANWPLLRDSRYHYLLYKQVWLRARDIDGNYKYYKKRPPGLDKIDPTSEHGWLLVPLAKEKPDVAVQYTAEPSELIVIDGEPAMEEIPATNLTFVANTQSPLIKHEETFYFLTSGRWFATTDLDGDSWTHVTQLPDSFLDIPVDHGMAHVRVSVAGTVEAKTALLEANIPQEKTLDKNKQLTLDDQYDGEPKFETIPNTSIGRAVNSPYDIFFYQNVFYLCYEGAWYQADVSGGPWTTAFRVPDEIYSIPASSPSYPVTQVKVASSTPTTVTYSASTSYYTGVYAYYGMPVYGTGWYYPPYFGLYWYWPRYVSYGYGSFYNPRTGMYGTRSVWYGPYGGYSYNEHYNPRTGRSGYVETAWDGDEWASYGESYNPRTQIYTETSRYYDDDTHRLESEREIARGDNRIETEREMDFDDGWGITSRETSKGGSSYVEHHRQEDGSIVSEGSFTTGDGKSGDIYREIDDGTRKTQITGDDGGKLVSGSDGDNRGTLGKDSEGNLYAGKNGNVFKKSDDGWYQYDHDNGWQEYEREREARQREQMERNWSGDGANREGNRDRAGTQQRNTSRDWQSSSDRMNQLNRDHRARSQGYGQFNSRRSHSYNRNYNRGNFSRGGMRGGGMRRR